MPLKEQGRKGEGSTSISPSPQEEGKDTGAGVCEVVLRFISGAAVPPLSVGSMLQDPSRCVKPWIVLCFSL